MSKSCTYLWIVLFCIHFAFMTTAAYIDAIFFAWGILACLSFVFWSEDFKRKAGAKSIIIPLLILVSTVGLVYMYFLKYPKDNVYVDVAFWVVATLQIVFLFLTTADAIILFLKWKKENF